MSSSKGHYIAGARRRGKGLGFADARGNRRLAVPGRQRRRRRYWQL